MQTEERTKSIEQISQIRSPPSKAGKQKLSSYSNINDISTNYIYNSNNFSSQKKETNPIKAFELKSDEKKVLFEDVEENMDYQNLATNVRIQNRILEEYENWINILLSVIDSKKINNNYEDIGTPIQQGLAHIEKIKNENLKIKTLILNNKQKNDIIENSLDKKHKTQNMIIKEYNEKDKNKILNIKKEKEQLILNVQMLANELDELNENNKLLFDKIQKENKLQKIYELYNLRNQLQEENKLYKKIMVFKNRKDCIDSQESLDLYPKELTHKDLKKRNSSITNKSYSYMGNGENKLIGRLSSYGEYKLEKEENINTSDSIFFCGL